MRFVISSTRGWLVAHSHSPAAILRIIRKMRSMEHDYPLPKDSVQCILGMLWQRVVRAAIALDSHNDDFAAYRALELMPRFLGRKLEEWEATHMWEHEWDAK